MLLALNQCCSDTIKQYFWVGLLEETKSGSYSMKLHDRDAGSVKELSLCNNQELQRSYRMFIEILKKF